LTSLRTFADAQQHNTIPGEYLQSKKIKISVFFSALSGARTGLCISMTHYPLFLYPLRNFLNAERLARKAADNIIFKVLGKIQPRIKPRLPASQATTITTWSQSWLLVK